MDDNKKKFIGLTVLSTVLSVLAAVGAKLFFPNMMAKCKELCCPPPPKKRKK